MGKIKDFEMFNRCHSSTMREKMCGIMYAHTAILKYYEGRLQMKGRGSYRQKERDIQKEQSYRNFMDKLYQYDSIEKTQCIQYGKTKVSQPKFRGENLQLKDYQVDGLNWLIRAWHERRNVVLADEMGLGKTIISVTFLDHIAKTTKVFGPFLIVAPLSTLDHWVRVVQDWTYLNPVLYYDSKGGNGRQALMDWEWYMPEITQGGNTTLKNSIFKPHVVITSYEVFMQDIRTVLKHVPFMYMVIDEAHRLKNAKTKVLSLMKEHPCRNILLLTGTPVQNNTSELFSILNYIEPDKFCDEEAFKERFGNLTNNDQISDLKKLIKPHFLRRKKDDVEFSIPPLNETVIEVGLTSLQKAYYKGIYSENRSVLAQFGSSSVKTSQLNNLDMQLRKCCDHLYMLKGVEEDLTENIQSYDEELQKLKDASGKLILVDKFIEKYRKQNHKILIFSQFTSCLEILERYLVLKRIRTEKLTGSINSTDRVLSIQRFNEDKRFGVFLLTTKAGGLGINLAIARVVIIFDSDWNPQNDLQAIARAHRIGQKFSVQVYRLITADTYEQEMFKRASKKLGMEQAIFSKGDFTDENFSNTGNFNEIKNNPNEVENLLKHGAYAFLNEENDKENDIESLDIDKLIEDAGKGGLKKGYNYEKKTFDVAEHERDIPDFQNDKFWNKIFSDDIPSVANLEKEFKSNRKKLLKNQEALVIFLDKLDRAIEDLMDSCKNKQTLSDLIKDDEEKIRFILEAVLKSKTVDLDAKERAKDMLDLVTSTLYQHQTFTKKARKDLSKVKGKSGPRLKKRSRPSTQQSENENDPNMIMGCQSLAAAMSTPKDSQDKSSSQNSGGFNLGLRSKRLEKIKQKKLENEEMERRHSKVENLINSKLVRSRQKRLPSINYAETESISDSSPTNNAHSLPLETPYIDEDYQKDLNTEHDEEILPIQKPKKPKKSKKSKKVKKVKTKPRKH
ncbi:unnamed protein product [Moneuplotes crassus]|uniref:Uncharacterized protein n=1 Tax=Euplotes crassus TaxID=5936 RepID=A0AAD1U624_EUPCR|nr:unnamed protein product [Moneuplotes crassus]